MSASEVLDPPPPVPAPAEEPPAPAVPQLIIIGSDEAPACTDGVCA